jgi:hypothetical protein
MTRAIAIALLAALAACATTPATTVPQDRMLNAAPLSTCVVLCVTTVQQANTEGSQIKGAAGDVALDKSKSQESTKAVAPPQPQ